MLSRQITHKIVARFRMVHAVTYRIWLVLLTARLTILIAALAVLALDAAISRVHAQTAATGSRVGQIELADLLESAMSASGIAKLRASCVTGHAAVTRAQIQKVVVDSASVGAWCTTVLTRAGRDGILGYVRDPNATGDRPSQSFDDGFVAGYLARQALPSSAPAMAVLLPIADRCIAQAEPSLKLCKAAGQVMGARAATGETISIR